MFQLSLSSLLDSPCKQPGGSGNSMFTTTLPLSSLFNDNSRDFHAHKSEVRGVIIG